MESLIVINPQVDLEKARKVFDVMDIAENTRTDYKYRIGLFIQYLTENPLNRETFRTYKRYLQNRLDFCPSTKNKYLTAARIFLKELSFQGALPLDITLNTKGFKQDKKHKKDGINDVEIKSVMERLQNLEDGPESSRLKAVFSLLALQGLRQIEIVRLNIEDLDLLRRVAFVQGKGRDDKEPIYLQPYTVECLQRYLSLNNLKSGPLFVSRSNRGKNGRLTTKSIRCIVKEQLSGLNINKSTHGFRHYFTTKLIKQYRGDYNIIKQYTRHRSIEMLEVYHDDINIQEDLPRFYETFNNVSFG